MMTAQMAYGKTITAIALTVNWCLHDRAAALGLGLAARESRVATRDFANWGVNCCVTAESDSARKNRKNKHLAMTCDSHQSCSISHYKGRAPCFAKV